MWWLVGLSTLAVLVVVSFALPSRWPDALRGLLALAVTALAFGGFVRLFIPPEPETQAAQVANEQCSAAADERYPNWRTLDRYGSCHGYNACVQKARLDGKRAACADWRQWPDESEADAITAKYLDVYREEIAREAQEEGRKHDQYGDIWGGDPEPEEPPCTSVLNC